MNVQNMSQQETEDFANQTIVACDSESYEI